MLKLPFSSATASSTNRESSLFISQFPQGFLFRIRKELARIFGKCHFNSCDASTMFVKWNKIVWHKENTICPATVHSAIQETLPRLTAMIRGIGDPLVAAYARAYLCRVRWTQLYISLFPYLPDCVCGVCYLGYCCYICNPLWPQLLSFLLLLTYFCLQSFVVDALFFSEWAYCNSRTVNK